MVTGGACGSSIFLLASLLGLSANGSSSANGSGPFITALGGGAGGEAGC